MNDVDGAIECVQRGRSGEDVGGDEVGFERGLVEEKVVSEGEELGEEVGAVDVGGRGAVGGLCLKR